MEPAPRGSRMEHEAAQLEKQHVHSVYENTAAYFSDLQTKAWPRVRNFLLEQKPGSLVVDIDFLGVLACFLCLHDDFSPVQHIIAKQMLVHTIVFSVLFKLIKYFYTARFNKCAH